MEVIRDKFCGLFVIRIKSLGINNRAVQKSVRNSLSRLGSCQVRPSEHLLVDSKKIMTLGEAVKYVQS